MWARRQSRLLLAVSKAVCYAVGTSFLCEICADLDPESFFQQRSEYCSLVFDGRFSCGHLALFHLSGCRFSGFRWRIALLRARLAFVLIDRQVSQSFHYQNCSI
jgi:hypothetical protein